MPFRTAALTYAGVLLGFKIWSFVLIYLFSGGEGTLGFLLGTHVIWFAIPVLLLWAPTMFWYRMIRMRRRRNELRRSEWHIDQRPPAQR